MVNVAGVSSLVVILKLFTVGACGTGSLLVGLEEQVNTKNVESATNNSLIYNFNNKLSKM
tara:strand:- start:270 stop:449 length:180 start_codon:yes stop_codon:yes gene_type:complete